MQVCASAKLSRSWVYGAGLVAFLFLFLRHFVLPCVPLAELGDQLLFFARAQHILHGSVIYRDFFEVVPPGNDLLDAAILHAFGLHSWVIPAVDVAVGLAMFAVITLTAAEILERHWVLLPGMLFLAFVFSESSDVTHHWYSTLAAQAAIYVLMRGRSARHLAVAGLLCATSMLFTQTHGAFAFVAIAIYLIWTGHKEGTRRQLISFVLPCVVLVASVLGYYALRAGWRTLYFDLVVFPARFMTTSEVNTPRTYLHQFPAMHAAGDLLRLIPYLFVYALVPYVYIIGAYRLWRGRRELPVDLRDRMFLLHLMGIALVFAVANGPRFYRLCTVSPCAVLVFVWLLSGPARSARTVRNFAYGVGALFMLLLVVSRQARWHGTLQLPTGRAAFIDRQDAAEFAWMAAQTHPGDAFFNKTALSLYLALNTPTMVEFINDDEFTRPEQVTAVIAWMQQNRPRFVVLQPNANLRQEHSNSGPFRQYVQTQYRLARVFSLDGGAQREEIWERNP